MLSIVQGAKIMLNGQNNTNPIRRISFYPAVETQNHLLGNAHE